MKTLIIFWICFCNFCYAIRPNQPDSVGICVSIYNPDVNRWGTLFEETNTYFVSCGHNNFYPREGETLIFGNGESRIVEKVWVIGTKRSTTTFDLVIGKLNFPVNTKKAEAWWHLPKSFYTEPVLTGFGLSGAYSGDSCRYQRMPDVSTDIIINTVTEVSLGGGNSGSPVWHKGKLIGILTGSVGNDSIVCPLFIALIKCSDKFPEKFQTDNKENVLGIKMINDRFMDLEINFAPGNDYKISASIDLSNWFDADLIPEFRQLDEISTPWKRHYTFDTTGREKMIFRGETLP